MKITTHRPTWCEIDLGAIKTNFLRIKKLAGCSVMILAGVKANAYSHGIKDVAEVLAGAGVDFFGVGSIDEAIELKRLKLGVPILNLTAISQREIYPVIACNIIQTVSDIGLAKKMDMLAGKSKKRVKVHLKVDTGMGRLGVWYDEAMHFIKEAIGLKHIKVDGLFTHFSSVDEDLEFTTNQIKKFNTLLDSIKDAGIKIKYIHAANSAAALRHPETHFNLIRPGIIIYGLYPDKNLKNLIMLKPAFSLKSKIISIKDVPAGRRISYGNTYTTKRNTKIAVIPIGYADGYNRLLSNKADILVRGQKARIVGRVCMDQIMVDVGKIKNVSWEDEVVLIGRQGKREITVDEIARLCNTISYEVICAFGPRVKRIYKK